MKLSIPSAQIKKFKFWILYDCSLCKYRTESWWSYDLAKRQPNKRKKKMEKKHQITNKSQLWGQMTSIKDYLYSSNKTFAQAMRSSFLKNKTDSEQEILAIEQSPPTIFYSW